MMNRVRKCRIQAGLSEGQAKRLLNVDGPTLARIEDMAALVPDELAQTLAEMYGVGVGYLRGEGPSHDYATVDGMRGAENLTTSDRDTIAEFAASLHGRPPMKTWAQIKEEKAAELASGRKAFDGDSTNNTPKR